MRVLFAAHDRGGMNAILPVIQRMARAPRRFLCRGLFEGPARDTARNHAIAASSLSISNQENLEKMLRSFRPDVILTGTSTGRTLEKRLWQVARRLGTPSIAVLDAWYNYAFQFSQRKDGSFSVDELPDKICVMDERAKRDMRRAGFPARRLIVTGNPFFDTFKPFPAHPRSRHPFVLFVDQHFSELLAQGEHEDLGIDERDVLREVVVALARESSGCRVRIKLHPGSRDLRRYDEVIRSSPIDIKIETVRPMEAMLRDASMVVGMNSAVLFEAALRGKSVVSYQPNGSRARDPLMSNHWGLSVGVYSPSRLPAALHRGSRKTHASERAQTARRFVDGQAIRRVIHVVESF